MNRAILLAIPIVLILLTSGCTIPGTNILIPVPWGTTVEYENDIVILRDVRAYPSQISPVQSSKLVAYVQNIGSSPLKDVEVRLYDYCSGLFTISKTVCGGTAQSAATEICRIDLLPQETKEVDWTISVQAPKDIAVRSDCDTKLYVRYNYSFAGVTTAHFITPTEFQKQLERGTYQEVASYIAAGEGPIKGYLTLEDKQPFPTDTNAQVTMALQIVNKGMGFLVDKNIPSARIVITPSTLQTAIRANVDKTELKLIGRESPKVITEVPWTDFGLGTFSTETTKQLSLNITNYQYEFRQTAKISVLPQA